MSLIRKIIEQSLLTNLLSVLIIVAGISTVLKMKREAFPEVNFDIVTINTVYLGASPKEVEKLVTIPIEDELRGVSELKKVNSISIEGLSLIFVEIDPDARDKDKVVNNIQRAVDQADDLPDDCEDPIVKEVVTGETPIIDISVGGNLPFAQLRSHAEALENRLLDIPGVNRIDKEGFREPEIAIEVDPAKLARHYVSMDEIVQAVRNHSLNIPGGTLKTPTKEWLVRTVGEINEPQPYNELTIRSDPDGNRLKIEDVGRAIATYKEEDKIYKVRGERAIILRVVKKRTGDTISIIDQANKILDRYRSNTSSDLMITTFNDQSFFIRRRLNILINNGWVGIFLVLAVLLVFLNWRIAMVTALGIPIAFFLTFLAMRLIGIPINLISMFGLIIVLGMIVDDAIIIAENCYRYLENGKTPREAAIIGTAEVIRPVTVTILTTIASFLPLMFMSGIFGKFVWQIPTVVILALSASLLEAFFVLPSHIVDFAKTATHQTRNAFDRAFDRFRDFYLASLKVGLRFRYLVVTFLILAMLGAGLLARYKMKFILFPAEGIELFFIRATLPDGMPLESTEKAMKPIEEILGQLPDNELENFTTVTGIQQSDPTDPLTKRGTNVSQIVVYLTPPQMRDRSADDIIRSIKKEIEPLDTYENISFERARPGPPVGKPVAVRIKGDDLEALDNIAELVKAKLKTIDGLFSIDDDFEEGKAELRVIINEAKAKRASLSLAQIGNTVRQTFFGEIATKLKTTKEEIDVAVRFSEPERRKVDALDSLLIRNSAGNLIPFKNVAHIEEAQGINAIKHRDNDRTVTVVADLDETKTSAVEVNTLLVPIVKELETQFPDISITLGGEFEDTQESLKSLGEALGLAVFLIFIVLTTLFRSLFRPFIVIATIPLGLIGVVIAFFFHGIPLSFMAFLGIVGLAGVVVNDSIVLVDFIKELRRSGVPDHESIMEGGKTRFRPVLLTTFTTVMGLFPVAYGIGGLDPFLKPAAMAICWGLLFGTMVILIAIPCFHAIQDDFAIKKENILSRFKSDKMN